MNFWLRRVKKGYLSPENLAKLAGHENFTSRELNELVGKRNAVLPDAPYPEFPEYAGTFEHEFDYNFAFLPSERGWNSVTDNEHKANIRKNIYTSRMKAAASRTRFGKSAESDVLIVAVRHIPFRDADELLSRWNAAEMGYIFHIYSENLYAQDYLQKKYLLEETKE